MLAGRGRGAAVTTPYTLHVVPRTAELQQQWLSWHQTRGSMPAIPEDMILIADGRGLICGCGLFPTAGPYVLAEHLATNPSAPMRLRHRAVSALLRTLKAYCAMRAKHPIAIIRHRSLVRLLAREGFSAQSAVVMSASPVLAL